MGSCQQEKAQEPSMDGLDQPEQTFGLPRSAQTHSGDRTHISTESPHRAFCTSNPAGFKASPRTKPADH